MFENKYYLEEQLLIEQHRLMQLQRMEHQVQQASLTIKYNILIERNQLDIKHLKQVQLLESLHIREIFNMKLKQVLILNQSQCNQLIKCQQVEQKQLKDYQKFEQSLMFKKNNLTNQLKKYYKPDSQIEVIYQKIEKINFQKEKINRNIIFFFQKKNFELSTISL